MLWQIMLNMRWGFKDAPCTNKCRKLDSYCEVMRSKWDSLYQWWGQKLYIILQPTQRPNHPQMSLITEVNQHIYLAISVLSLPQKLICHSTSVIYAVWSHLPRIHSWSACCWSQSSTPLKKITFFLWEMNIHTVLCAWMPCITAAVHSNHQCRKLLAWVMHHGRAPWLHVPPVASLTQETDTRATHMRPDLLPNTFLLKPLFNPA